MELVFIPAGEFDMGSPAGEQDRGHDEGPVRRVRITRPFYMGRCEVTQGQWQKVMDYNPSGVKGSDRLPVEGVSWDDCQEFLRMAGHGLRLPTEAEWEYACRAGTKTRFSFGDDADHRQLGDHAWYGGNSDQTTHPVGRKKANGWGLHDVYGNVAEWCRDWSGYETYSKDNTRDDPTGPATGAYRVLRGGGRYSAPRYCRSATRSGGAPDLRGFYFDVGLRVVVGIGPER